MTAMASVKTAISIRPKLAADVDRLCKRTGVSRSRFFSAAAEEYLRRHRAEDLLARLNRVYTDIPATDPKLLAAAKRKHRQRIEGTW